MFERLRIHESQRWIEKKKQYPQISEGSLQGGMAQLHELFMRVHGYPHAKQQEGLRVLSDTSASIQGKKERGIFVFGDDERLKALRVGMQAHLLQRKLALHETPDPADTYDSITYRVGRLTDHVDATFAALKTTDANTIGKKRDLRSFLNREEQVIKKTYKMVQNDMLHLGGELDRFARLGEQRVWKDQVTYSQRPDHVLDMVRLQKDRQSLLQGAFDQVIYSKYVGSEITVPDLAEIQKRAYTKWYAEEQAYRTEGFSSQTIATIRKKWGIHVDQFGNMQIEKDSLYVAYLQLKDIKDEAQKRGNVIVDSTETFSLEEKRQIIHFSQTTLDADIRMYDMKAGIQLLEDLERAKIKQLGNQGIREQEQIFQPAYAYVRMSTTPSRPRTEIAQVLFRPQQDAAKHLYVSLRQDLQKACNGKGLPDDYRMFWDAIGLIPQETNFDIKTNGLFEQILLFREMATSFDRNFRKIMEQNPFYALPSLQGREIATRLELMTFQEIQRIIRYIGTDFDTPPRNRRQERVMQQLHSQLSTYLVQQQQILTQLALAEPVYI